MDELWQQGDQEKAFGLSVSFLCDRISADVPKSQIGFIRGIITPTFDVLVELLPALSYLKEVIEDNLDEWSKIIEMKKIMTPKITRTPQAIQIYKSRSPKNELKNFMFKWVEEPAKEIRD